MSQMPVWIYTLGGVGRGEGGREMKVNFDMIESKGRGLGCGKTTDRVKEAALSPHQSSTLKKVPFLGNEAGLIATEITAQFGHPDVTCSGSTSTSRGDYFTSIPPTPLHSCPSLAFRKYFLHFFLS